MIKRTLLIFGLFVTTIIPSQKIINCDNILRSGDCSSAINIRPENKLTFICSPKGSGKELEIKNNSLGNLYFFEKEHHTMWLNFSCPYNAIMEFEIIPFDSTYDFDFLLFENVNNNFCNSFISEKTKPVRSNISRNDVNQKSKTGLKIKAKDSLVQSGENSIYSKSIKVDKQSNYYLIIDNVYGGNRGFEIEFNYFENQKITGKTIDKNKQPVLSNIKIEKIENGETVALTNSDSITGIFNFEYYANIKENYHLTTESKSYFFTENSIDKFLIKDSSSVRESIFIPKLVKNENLKLHNLNFHGGSYEYLSSAIPSLNRLLNLMKNNSSLKIMIEGHTNGCPNGVEDSQILSENRAKSIMNFLVSNGINQNRLMSKGFNCSKMLYPQMKTPLEQMMNRRVEILVTDF